MRLKYIFLVLSFIAFSSTSLHSQQTKNPAYIHIFSLDKDGEMNGSGSGTHLGDGFVLTAAHVVLREGGPRESRPIKRGSPKSELPQVTWKWDADGEPQGNVETVWVDKNRDVALLKITNYGNLEKTEVICRDPIVKEEVSISAFPMLFGRVESQGRVIAPSKKRQLALESPTFLIDITVLPGMSGGAIIAKDGIVGIINAFPMISPTIAAPSIGIGTSGSVICESLNEYTAKVKK